MTRVLVVDDCAESVTAFSRLLALCGYKIEAARTGEEALRLASVFQPEMAFLELWMPQMDGYELAKRLRQLEGLSEIRIIALSGKSPNRDATGRRESTPI